MLFIASCSIQLLLQPPTHRVQHTDRMMHSPLGSVTNINFWYHIWNNDVLVTSYCPTRHFGKYKNRTVWFDLLLLIRLKCTSKAKRDQLYPIFMPETYIVTHRMLNGPYPISSFKGRLLINAAFGKGNVK